MEEFKKIYLSLPPFSRYFCTGVFLVTFTVTYLPVIDPRYFLLDFGDVLFKLQLWRLVTNLMFIGKFSLTFVFYTMMIYFRLSKLERKALQDKLYGEFIMTVLYCVCLIYIVVFIYPYTSFCSQEFLFFFLYIDSKRDPDSIANIWGFQVKNKFVPYVFAALTVFTGGDVMTDLVGIGVGHVYYYLKEVAPIENNLDLLKTPQIVHKFFYDLMTPDQVRAPPRPRPAQNTESQPRQVNINSSFREEPSPTQNTAVPFGGRHNHWG